MKEIQFKLKKNFQETFLIPTKRWLQKEKRSYGSKKEEITKIFKQRLRMVI